MVPITQPRPVFKSSIADDDFDLRDRAVIRIAREYALSINVAKVVVSLAGIGEARQ
jgi:hypothetical protein